LAASPAGHAAPERSPLATAAEVDRLLQEAWAASFSEPAPGDTETALFRRLSLDVRGVIPHADEVERFVADRSGDRMIKWTEWFLGTPDFAEYQAEVWEQLLIGRKSNPDGLDRGSFRRYLRDGFLRNKPYDEMAREILLSEGMPEDNPGVNFYLRYEAKPVDVAGRVARVFLGTRIECAQCHDHPYADVKREEFFGFAAFFSRTQRYRGYDRAGGNSRQYGVRSVDKGEMMMPPMKKGEREVKISPLFFGERYQAPVYVNPFKQPPKKKSRVRTTSPKEKSTSGKMSARGRRYGSGKSSLARRKQLLSWLTSGKNKYFARALVNRVWAQFLGKGFVNPVDDFSNDSQIVLPKVLEYLTEDFVDSGYDMRRLIRVVVTTRAYRQQATSGVPGGIAPGEDHDLFASVPVRSLEPEVLARSVLRASGMEEPQPEENSQRVRSYIDKARRDFVRRFGIDEAEKRPEFQGTVLQVLLLFNGEFTAGKAPASRPFHARYQKKYPGNLDVVLHGVPPAKQVDRLFLATLSRPPTAAERQAFQRHLHLAKDDNERQKSLADLQWALLNSAEFLHSS